jgi:hypothetical protein
MHDSSGEDAGHDASSEANESSTDDAGPDALPPKDATLTSQTIGNQCTAVFTELCTQAITRCDVSGFTVDECINDNLPTCCTGSRCNQVSQFSSSDVSACTSAIDAEGCELIAMSNSPSQCADFVQDQ